VAATKRPTIETVAERAGVSKSLVSLVMRDAPERLRRAPPEGARRGRRARLPAEPRRAQPRRAAHAHARACCQRPAQPVPREVIDWLHESAHERGLRLVLGTGRRDPAQETEVLESFLAQDIDGLILLSPAFAQRVLAGAAKAGADRRGRPR
jgi:DNA-binding LacI/PurR family transcriptional regulator